MTTAQASITCPRCGCTSYHPEDIRTGYCVECHWWTSRDPLRQICGQAIPGREDRVACGLPWPHEGGHAPS